MRILKIISGYPPLYVAGSEIYSQTLCEALSDRHQVDVFTGAQDPYRADFEVSTTAERPNLRVHRLNLPRGRDVVYQRGADAALATLVDEIEPQVAHIGHLFYLSMGLVDVLADRGIPIVYTLHDFWLMCPRGQFLQINHGERPFHRLCEGQDDDKCARRCFANHFTGAEDTFEADLTYWRAWIGRRMAAARSLSSRVSRFIAPSRHIRQRFIEGFGLPPDKVTYLDYGFPTGRLRPPARHNPAPHMRFGYIGTHSPSKGIDLLIRAFARLTSPAELLIFGHPRYQSTDSLKALAASAPNPVRFMGGYDNATMVDEVFAHIDCAVVPSIWTENSPLVIHEAQACHIPVITADVGGMAEYVHHEVNGLLFRHRNEDSLHDALAHACANPAHMTSLGARGYLFSDDGQIPDIQAHVEALEEIYRFL